MNEFLRGVRGWVLVGLLGLVAGAGAQTRLVISQMYGGGGNTGAQFTNDFVELYNPTAAAISLNGLSLQYAAATSASWNSVALPNVSVAPGHYFLIQAAAGTTVTNAPLSPAADFVVPATGSSGNALNFSATAGKVVIANGTAALAVGCPAASAYVDLIGFGPTASCFEGTGPAPAPSNTTADVRTNLAVDNVNNAADFVTAAPTPHNSGSATVPVVPPTVAINVIQGVKSTTASTVSAYAGQRVTTTGVVTAALSNAFFIQSRDVDADTNPLTPEGIEIFTSTRPTVAVGNYVQVSGTVQTYPAVTASHTPATEITSPTVTVLTATVALPTAVTLTAAMLTPGGGLYQLTPYEGMRVSVASLTAVSGTNGSITSANEANELATSSGYFYAVITGTARPFREPGVDIRDPAVTGLPAGVAKFDDNPERILVDSTIAGGTSLEISTGAVLPSVTGVLDFTFSADSFYDPSRLILDATYNRAQVVAGMAVQAVALPAATEFTVASFNVERFYNTNNADDLYYVPSGVNGYNGNSSTPTVSTGQTFISAATDVTAAAYARRLAKVSLAIRTVLNSPDVVTIEEVENQSVLNDIAAQVNSDAGVSNLYTAYSTDNSAYYTQDGTGISVGFLVKNTVNKLGVTQFGAGETFTPSSGNLTTLNDRPWLVLTAGVKRSAGVADYPVTVIVNHMKALTGENSATSNSTRLKKELQAEDIAKYIGTLQAAGKHVISGGDFNAFEFSDGYGDALATYTNTNVLPATQVLQPGVSGLVTPPLTDLTLTLPANQRWSYVEDGSAQVLDHMVVTPELVTAGAHMAFAHLDADFPATAYNDVTTAARTSDHDALVGYFNLPAPVLAGSLTPAAAAGFGSVAVGASSGGQVFTFSNTGEGPIAISRVTATGDYAVISGCIGTLALGATCSANVVFSPTATGARTGTLTVATNVSGGSFGVALSGTGTAAVLPTLAPAALTFASAVLNTSSVAQVVTLSTTATIATPIASVVATGDFTQTNTCGTSLAAGGACTISVVFKPTVSGTRSGTLTVVTTGAGASTLSATLTGVGLMPDFTVADAAGKTATSVSVTAGSAGTVPLTFTSVNGFNGTIGLTCALGGTAPTGVTCAVPASFTLAGTSGVQNVTFTTTSRSTAAGFAMTGGSSRGEAFVLLGLAGVVMALAYRARRLGRLAGIGGLVAVLAAILCLGAAGCGGTAYSNPNATLPGSYTYTVTATGGGISHAETVTLIVQ